MSMADILKAAAKSAAIRRMSDEARQLPTPRTVRRPSKNETDEVWTPPAFGLLFCVHRICYFQPCTACRRTKELAQLEYAAFCKRHSLNR